MLCVMDSLARAHDDGLVSYALFIDFAKAFDRVPHIPLHKLESCEMCGQMLAFSRLFLREADLYC